MLAPSPLKSRPAILLALIIIAVLVAGCATTRPATIEDRNVQIPRSPRAAAPVRAPATVVPEPQAAATYTVKRGDTLHQIALDSGLDYRDLAAWNNIENVNRIFPGQVLRLAAPGAAPAQPQPQPQSQPQEGASDVTTAPLRTVPAIAESRASATSAPPVATAVASGAAPAVASPNAATAPRAVAASGGGIKTSPKAVKEPYSEQAVRDLTLAASAGPAPPDALAMAAPGGVRTDAKSEPRPSVAPSPPASSSVTPPSTAAISPPANSPSTPAARSPPQDGASPGAGNDADALDWAWPAKGKVVTAFSETANLKGIDIAGTAGEAVRASAAGKVVYAGSGLRGYGKLIIIKHNATYLSAYAHNREILVKEGQQVARGQKIAEMGNTDADQVKLHFEIRRRGKPIDPAKYLPPA